MDNLLNIALRATNPDQGVDREYVLCLGEDLLGGWIVMVHYGRYGRRGVAKNISFTTRQEACHYISLKLKRHLSAHKRIGCNYQLTKLDGMQGFMEFISHELMERFSK